MLYFVKLFMIKDFINVHKSPSLHVLCWHQYTHMSGHYALLPTTKEEVNVFARLSVCLLARLLKNSDTLRLLKNACMDVDEMLRVDRCRDMDELINFWARSGL